MTGKTTNGRHTYSKIRFHVDLSNTKVDIGNFIYFISTVT